MRLQTWSVVLVLGVVLLAVSAYAAPKQKGKDFGSAKPQAAGEKPVKTDDCYACHAPVKDLHGSGKHAKVNCASCHRGVEKHIQVKGPDGRPQTDLSWNACGSCHKVEFDSFKQTAHHRPARDEKSQLSNRAPNPYWDKLMMGHGFTKEHNLTRSHTWMLVDHFVVDRAYGGRFQPKEGWEYVAAQGGAKAWSVLKDQHPDSKEHKPFLTQSAAAANPTCLQCKTQDHILDWPYMGDPDPKAKWNRTSNVVELARTLEHGLGRRKTINLPT
ncbi:MAG: hypothetical protein HY897_08600 [Deltaproteobacteria bacterium]|nr:hypothetical protein [Deltaproteobacteria bacterium]